MSTVVTLQNAIAFDAAVLTGGQIGTFLFDAIQLWFTPADAYDGTVNFEVSPDGGTTWFAAEGVDLADSSTLSTTLASPAATDCYIVTTPAFNLLRARMSGGSVGSLTVYGMGVYFNR